MHFSQVLERIGQGVDLAGVAVMILGLLVATLYFLNQRRQGNDPLETFQRYRHDLGRAILLGLEILIVADIIRTVAIEPTFTSLGILATIVLIRTFLSWTLELELAGRWPWQQQGSKPVETRRPSPDFVAINEL
jgi:uncharacterized membrane protein